MAENTKKYVKPIPGSEDAYAKLKPITDAAQEGTLKPWSPQVIELITSYGITVDRRTGQKAEVTVSFPKSTENRSMAVGVRHAKDDGTFAEDLFVFEEGVGLTCYYRGTQEEVLPEYVDTHHRPAIVLAEALPDIQRRIGDMQAQIDKVSAAAQPVPEISAMVRVQANNNRFDVTLTADGSKRLVAEKLDINGVVTELNQQFKRMYQIPQVNCPEGLFDTEQGEVSLSVDYRTMDGQQYRYTIVGKQEHRTGDDRYNVVFPEPAKIERI